MPWLCCCCPSQQPLEDELLTDEDNHHNSTLIQQPNAPIHSPNTPPMSPQKQQESQQKLKSPLLLKQQSGASCSSSRPNNSKIDYIPSNKRIDKPSPASEPKQIIKYKKSHLARENHQTILVYFNTKKDCHAFCSFRYLRRHEQKGGNNSLEHFLDKHKDKIIGVIGRSFMLTNRMDALCKEYHNVIVINYRLKLNSETVLGIDQLVTTDDLARIRLSGMDTLIILMDKLNSVEQVHEYALRIIRSLDKQDLSKIVYFFPIFMTLQQISELIFNLTGPHSDKTIEKGYNELNFDLEWVESSSLDSAIVVKKIGGEASKLNAQNEQIIIPMTLFGKKCNEEKLRRRFRQFYLDIKDRPFNELFKLKNILQENLRECRTKIKQFRCWDNEDFIKVESRVSLKYSKCEKAGFFYKIQKDFIESMKNHRKLDKEQKSKVSDSPYESEWDDNLKAEDIRLSSVLETISNSALEEEIDPQGPQSILQSIMQGQDEPIQHLAQSANKNSNTNNNGYYFEYV